MNDFAYALEMYGQALKDHYKARENGWTDMVNQTFDNIAFWQDRLAELAQQDAAL